MIDSRRTRGWTPSRGGATCVKGGLAVLALTGALLGGATAAAASGSQWISAGGDLQNTRWQAGEKSLGVGNVANQTGSLIVDGGTFNANRAAAPSLSAGTVANSQGVSEDSAD